MLKKIIIEIETESEDVRIESYLKNFLDKDLNVFLKENFQREAKVSIEHEGCNSESEGTGEAQ